MCKRFCANNNSENCKKNKNDYEQIANLGYYMLVSIISSITYGTFYPIFLEI